MALRSEEAGVTDVLGTILLVGITVAATVGLNILILNIPGPDDQLFVTLDMDVLPGADSTWGTGDERIQISHLAGESLPESKTRIYIDIAGTSETIQGASLGFDDARFDVGETWALTRTIAMHDDVDLAVIHHGSVDSIRFESSKRAEQNACSLDTMGPSAEFTQTPPDASIVLGTAAITITAVLSDLCSGVANVAPLLHYSLGAGSPITMTSAGASTWTADIPAPGGDWGTVSGQTLSYHLSGMKDLRGNLATSAAHTDFIQATAPGFIYAGTPTMIAGTSSGWTGAQAQDDGAWGTLSSSIAGGSGTLTLNTESVISTHTHWADEEKSYTQDGNGPKYSKSISHPLTHGVADPPAINGAIDRISIQVRQFQKDHVNDGWRLGVCLGAKCSTVSTTLTATPAWSMISYDVTDRRPGGGTWSWGDLTNLETKIMTFTVHDATNKNQPDGEWKADHIYVKVDYVPGHQLEATTTFSAVPASGSYTLEARYRSSVDQFRIEAWDGAAWQIKGTNLGATSFTPWSTALTASEYNGGNPQIRITSLGTAPTTASSIDFDYLRVRS